MLLDIYFFINAFLIGTIWDDIKPDDHSPREIAGFIVALMFFTVAALPIFIADRVRNWYLFDGGKYKLLQVKAWGLKLFKKSEKLTD